MTQPVLLSDHHNYDASELEKVRQEQLISRHSGTAFHAKEVPRPNRALQQMIATVHQAQCSDYTNAATTLKMAHYDGLSRGFAIGAALGLVEGAVGGVVGGMTGGRDAYGYEKPSPWLGVVLGILVPLGILSGACIVGLAADALRWRSEVKKTRYLRASTAKPQRPPLRASLF